MFVARLGGMPRVFFAFDQGLAFFFSFAKRVKTCNVADFGLLGGGCWQASYVLLLLEILVCCVEVRLMALKL